MGVHIDRCIMPGFSLIIPVEVHCSVPYLPERLHGIVIGVALLVLFLVFMHSVTN